jgi:hypothetical protein
MGSRKPPRVSRRRRGKTLTGRSSRQRDVTLVSHSRQRSSKLGLARGHARKSCLQSIFCDFHPITAAACWLRQGLLGDQGRGIKDRQLAISSELIIVNGGDADVASPEWETGMLIDWPCGR